MCGINGIVFKNKASSKDSVFSIINTMNNAIIHRGPDDDGVYVFDDHLAFGMRRLSIIDLSCGKQPIYNEAKNIVITFNGEIYNYKEIKENFINEGVEFYTDSDTEVVLKLYEKYGEGSLQHLDGMFAFAIHDKVKNKIFIARDRFGEKPLYYHQSKDEILWASELKSLISIRPQLKSISLEALNIYLALTYIPAPLTIYENVFKLKAGHCMTIDTTSLETTINKYWDIDIQEGKKNSIQFFEAKHQLRSLLFESVKKRMIADVPLGVFLSGGVDSTIIAAIMAKISKEKIKTFSVGYSDKRYDESERARMVANHIKSDHHEYILNYEELIGDIDKIILNYDEPFADASCLPTFFVSSKTAQKVKVALTGDGGDEVFGGYNKYLIHTYGKKYKSFIPSLIRDKVIKPLISSNLFRGKDSKSKLTKIRKMVQSIQSDTLTNHLNIIALGFKQNALSDLLHEGNVLDFKDLLKRYIHFPNIDAQIDELKFARYVDKQTSLEGDMLVKVDRASMFCSLECRSPFLDHKIMEFTYQIPDNFLLDGFNKKKILKETFKDLLPPDFFNAPKSGFEIPIATWFRNDLKLDLIGTLSEVNLIKHNYFKNDYVAGLINEHLNAGIDHSTQLWTLFSFQKWYNKTFEVND